MCLKQDVKMFFQLLQNFGQSPSAEEASDEDLYYYRKQRFNKLEGLINHRTNLPGHPQPKKGETETEKENYWKGIHGKRGGQGPPTSQLNGLRENYEARWGSPGKGSLVSPFSCRNLRANFFAAPRMYIVREGLGRNWIHVSMKPGACL